jgi:hypothetical protein
MRMIPVYHRPCFWMGIETGKRRIRLRGECRYHGVFAPNNRFRWYVTVVGRYKK